MNWIIKKIKRCICCMLTVILFALLIGTNMYTFKTASAWKAQEICEEVSFYYANDKGLVRIRQCEGK